MITMINALYLFLASFGGVESAYAFQIECRDVEVPIQLIVQKVRFLRLPRLTIRQLV